MASNASSSNQADGTAVGPFLVSFAIGAARRRDEYRLRYQVFVEECHFLPGCPDGLEYDEFDDSSCSMLVRDRGSDELAACQRLILPDRLPEDVLTNVEREYQRLPDRPPFDFASTNRHTWAEASRTTVAPAYRWGGKREMMPAMVAIKYASIALATACGRSALLSLSEVSTVRLIRRLGFDMIQIGAVIDFHGPRAPFRIDVESMVGSVAPDEQEMLAELIRAALAATEAWHSSVNSMREAS